LIKRKMSRIENLNLGAGNISAVSFSACHRKGGIATSQNDEQGRLMVPQPGLGYAMVELTLQQARIYSEIVQLLTPAQQQQLSEFEKERATSIEDSIERLSQSGELPKNGLLAP
jgi:hypothetical protein